MYSLLCNGALGNSLHTWLSASSFRESEYKGDFTLRHRKVTGHPLKFYKQRADNFEHCIGEAVKMGVNVETELVIQALEDLLDDKFVIQGELYRHPIDRIPFQQTLCLRYSFTDEALRNAMLLSSARESRGGEAKVILESYVPPEDVEDLYDLLDLYEDHVIEFSTLEKPKGIFRRRTVIWEVRSY
jgi:hypothetical protein